MEIEADYPHRIIDRPWLTDSYKSLYGGFQFAKFDNDTFIIDWNSDSSDPLTDYDRFDPSDRQYLRQRKALPIIGAIGTSFPLAGASMAELLPGNHLTDAVGIAAVAAVCFAGIRRYTFKAWSERSDAIREKIEDENRRRILSERQIIFSAHEHTITTPPLTSNKLEYLMHYADLEPSCVQLSADKDKVTIKISDFVDSLCRQSAFDAILPAAVHDLISLSQSLDKETTPAESRQRSNLVLQLLHRYELSDTRPTRLYSPVIQRALA